MKQIKTKILQLKRSYPKHSRYGQLYSNIKSKSKAFRSIVLYTLFVSDDYEHLFRPHVFKKDRAMLPEEWHAWLRKNIEDIEVNGILPGLSRRTDLSKQWSVQQYLGWTGNAKFTARNSAVDRQRNQTQRKRR